MTQSDYDVIVIGAGAAGMAATNDLVARGRSVICIEAGARTGGRIHTDTTHFGVPFDIGAHWLHNRHVNPFVEIGQAFGFSLYPAPEDIGITQGDDPEGTALWATADEMNKALHRAGRKGLDIAASEIIDMSHPWAATALMMHALPMGRDMYQVSTRDWYDGLNGENWFCREGFGTVFARYHANTPVTLGTAATKVTTTTHGVTVETSAGPLSAKAAIVTVSQGVLAAEAINFDPPLDKKHLRAIDGITLGDYNHIALQFDPGTLPVPDDCWVTYKVNAVKNGSVQGGGFLCNTAGAGLTYFETAGQFSRDLQEAGQDAAVDFALGKLAGIFGADIRRAFVKGCSTAWGLDPLFRGSYSGALPGQAHTRKALRKPHAERVFFAGEATHLSEQATVSGAHKEGLRAARKALKLLR
ncbi:MAG: FAD-dependent oxidoreductase [Pseudomonadota bacterium]